jgi:hypothetical protein
MFSTASVEDMMNCSMTRLGWKRVHRAALYTPFVFLLFLEQGSK